MRDFKTLVLRKMCSIKFRRTRELFWGRAKAKTPATFVPIGTNIDYENMFIVDGIFIAAGDELSFRTTFSDTEISINIFEIGVKKLNLAKGAFRIGYFQSKWKRLTDTQIANLNSMGEWGLTTLPILYEAKFKAKGFFFGADPVDYAAPGWNVNLLLKYGIDNSLGSAIDWKRLYGNDVFVENAGVRVGLWYNFYFDKVNRDGFGLSAGGSADGRIISVALDEGGVMSTTTKPSSDNADVIYKYFVTTSYRF